MKAIRTLPQLSARDKVRFWKHVNKDGPLPDQVNPHYAGLDKCWSWTGGTWQGGYGRFYAQSVRVGAHRIAFFLSSLSFNQEMEVMHKCDNPSCVNPSHLAEATHKTNMEDMFIKDRRKSPKGENHPRWIPGLKRFNRGAGHPRGERNNKSKLSANQVLEIRARFAAGNISQQALGDEFGIAQANISAIVLRKVWTHI